jgi:hypothetical protein
LKTADNPYYQQWVIGSGSKTAIDGSLEPLLMVIFVVVIGEKYSINSPPPPKKLNIIDL